MLQEVEEEVKVLMEDQMVSEVLEESPLQFEELQEHLQPDQAEVEHSKAMVPDLVPEESFG
jgi:hypothetical protein